MPFTKVARVVTGPKESKQVSFFFLILLTNYNAFSMLQYNLLLVHDGPPASDTLHQTPFL